MIARANTESRVSMDSESLAIWILVQISESKSVGSRIALVQTVPGSPPVVQSDSPLLVCESRSWLFGPDRWRFFHDLKLKMQLLAAQDVAKIELPKFAREAKRGPVLIQVGNEFQTEDAPEIGEADVPADGLQFDSRVEGKWSALGHEASE